MNDIDKMNSIKSSFDQIITRFETNLFETIYSFRKFQRNQHVMLHLGQMINLI